VYFEALFFHHQDKRTNLLMGFFFQESLTSDGKLNLNISCGPKYTKTQEHLHG